MIKNKKFRSLEKPYSPYILKNVYYQIVEESNTVTVEDLQAQMQIFDGLTKVEPASGI